MGWAGPTVSPHPTVMLVAMKPEPEPKWLKANPPSHFLRLGLLANGYGHILDRLSAGRHGRPTRHGNTPPKRARVLPRPCCAMTVVGGRCW
jgi:hypothetical protein